MPTVSRDLWRWLFKGGASLEDVSDRLNHVWTVGLLILLGCIISWKQGYSQPMVCWTPSQFTLSHARFAETACWNTYHITHGGIPRANLLPGNTLPVLGYWDENVSKLTYYQWLPLILCFQALLFKLPKMIMTLLHSYSGVSFSKLANLTKGHYLLTMSERDRMAGRVASYIRAWCESSPLLYQFPWRSLTLIWLVIKMLYCINVVVQLQLLDNFLLTSDVDNATSYGDVIYNNLFHSNATRWRVSDAFPRQALCDFSIRQMTNMHSYTVHCFIPANVFSENAYMFLWVWLLFVTVATLTNMFVWLLERLIPTSRRRFVERCLKASNVPLDPDIDRFTDGYLGEDGVLVLQLIEVNSSSLFTQEVIKIIWHSYQDTMMGTNHGILTGHKSPGHVIQEAGPSAPPQHLGAL